MIPLAGMEEPEPSLRSSIAGLCSRRESMNSPSTIGMGGWVAPDALFATHERPMNDLLKHMVSVRRGSYEVSSDYDIHRESGQR